jgi:hypothetical protein
MSDGEALMRYPCGTEVMLGDEIMVRSGPDLESLARVVAIGVDQAVPEIDSRFYRWARDEGILKEESIVVEWLGANPLETNDPAHAPVGNYMTLSSVCCETFVRRGL